MRYPIVAACCIAMICAFGGGCDDSPTTPASIASEQSPWTPVLPPSVNEFGGVYALEVHEGELYAAGNVHVAGNSIGFVSSGSLTGDWNLLGQTDRYITSMVSHAGSLFLGGGFSEVFNGWLHDEAELIGRYTLGHWYSVGFYPQDPDAVMSVLTLSSVQGQLLAGGVFTAAFNYPGDYISRWDGSGWLPLPGLLPEGEFGIGEVESICEFNGQIVVGGLFTTAEHADGSVNVARWSVGNWIPLSSETDGIVSALCVHDGKLIAGGSLSSIDGTPVNEIAAWDGVAWEPLEGGLVDADTTDNLGSSVYTVVSFNGDLVVGGYFAVATDPGIQNLAKWDGSAWSSMGVVANGVSDLCVLNGTLVACGSFLIEGEESLIAYWEPGTATFASALQSRECADMAKGVALPQGQRFK